MNTSSAVDSLSALAQETRLNIFRLLVQNAPKGLPAGEIARRLKLPGPTLSFHLNILAATQLIEPQRNGRSIRAVSCWKRGHRAPCEHSRDRCSAGRVDFDVWTDFGGALQSRRDAD